jgi:hypothetical protein
MVISVRSAQIFLNPPDWNASLAGVAVGAATHYESVPFRRYPPTGDRGDKLRRKVNREVPTGRLAPCPTVPAIGITGMPAGPAAGSAFQPVTDIVITAGLVAGAAANQLCGTDNDPIDAARPTPAGSALPAETRPGGFTEPHWLTTDSAV